jgi:SAM-dependent methyltransferase
MSKSAGSLLLITNVGISRRPENRGLPLMAHGSARSDVSDLEGGGSAGMGSDPYASFAATVALRQLSQWLPLSPMHVLDLSLPLPDAGPGFDSRVSDTAMAAGHRVTSVTSDVRIAFAGRHSHPQVVADARSLTWLRDESFDAVVAEGGALSDSLATEETLRDIARVLRPGGRLLATADSLVLGLARLAEQHRWPELADAPAADVVVVPDPAHAGGFTRCFSPEDLSDVLTECGLEVEWIYPRTALPEGAVRETLLADPDAMGDLVISELRLAATRPAEASGARLVVSGRKPGR